MNRRFRILGPVVALAVPAIVFACGKESAPPTGPTDSPSASSSATTTSADPTATTSATATATASAPATATASAPATATATAAAAGSAVAIPKFDVSCKADADCDLYMEGSAKDPCCPVCPNWRSANKPSVAAFKKACGAASACPVSCASVPMKAVCKAGSCAAVPTK